MRIGAISEDDYIAAKWHANDSRPSLVGDKAAILKGFAEGFDDEKDELVITSSIEQAYVVRMNIFFIEPGPLGAPFTNRLEALPETALQAEVTIFDRQGVLLDRTLLHAGHTAVWPPNGGYPSQRERMRRCAEKLGALTATRLKERAGEMRP